ncbi:saccharopine dehydrogenase family protein [Halobiforma nitratireducens]|uniref:Saccharopine dehydrogenase n=1 Tax=Halobiforma nitratireducens JCM 10879 TaxID=1227454 RepID=M0MHT3_9EURY|nr:saccharopine dehydrogenase NADP-binding domain-containing protein [Halobiforma nitratireducens]EMA45261.1 Saccharopine dehydrogenase [Halobiforma nitratireducens JCM 10879]
MNSLLVYGSYGYTGSLLASAAVSQGWSPIVAGRDRRKVHSQAEALGLEGRTFALESAAERGRVGTETVRVAAALDDVDAVLNCAGPFVDTAEPLVEACLETGTDYLDITGECSVFERLRQRDHRAREAGVTLLPGVGFDVVPTDCLAAFLADELPTGDRLSLGIKSESTLSRGTARTALESVGDGGVVRRNGRLLQVPAAFRTREIDFGGGPEHAVTVPFGDVVTAAHGTGLESVEVYLAVPPWASRALSLLDSAGCLCDAGPVATLLERATDAAFDGPDERELATDRAVVWGEVVDDTGRRARARLETPNPYALTVDAALAASERVLGDGAANVNVDPGFQTPATAFGSDFVLELEGTRLQLLEPHDVGDSSGSDPARSRLVSDG